MCISSLEEDPESASIYSTFKASVSTLAGNLSSLSSSEDFATFAESFDKIFSQQFTSGYKAFLEGMALKQDTIKFWHEYITKSGLAYIALHTAGS